MKPSALEFGKSDYFIIKDEYRNNKFYDGNTKKFGVTIDNIDYIIKMSKDNDLSVYTEYIASNFICKVGIPCHEVFIGEYNGKVVDVLKDFTSGTGYHLHSFKKYENLQ